MPKKKGAAKGGRRKISKTKAEVVEQTGQGAFALPPSGQLSSWYNQFSVSKTKLDKAAADHRNLCKQMEEAGVAASVIRTGASIMKKDDLANQSFYTQLSLLLQEIGAKVQFNVHQAKYADAVEEAKVKGYADGLAARDPEHSWVKGSPAARQYDESYAEAQAENAGKLAKKAA